MKIIEITLLVLVTALLSLFSCRKPEIGHTENCSFTPGAMHPKAAVYQSVMDKYTANGLPGISALIRDEDGVWVGASGKADIGKNVDMSPCTVSKAASLTKTFIAALALKLVEEGKFGLDDPLTQWLPEKPLSNLKNANISTVRQLLNHTTGIADVIEDEGFYLAVLNDPARKWTPEDLLEFVYGDDPVFAPGGGVSYSNTNFLLLAMVINRATGQDHSQLLREKVLVPLALDQSFYYWHDDLPENVAQGYFDLYNNQSIVNVTNFNTGSGNGYGGLYSNVFDLQTFIEALVRDKTLLSQNTLDQMLTFGEPEGTTNKRLGLGIFKDFLERAPDQFAYGHRGRDLGYTADMFWFPNQDYTMTYLINYGSDAKSELRQQFYDFRKEIVDVMME
ncbi:MAG: serine hydrolase [Saprospiraceae bacterium]|nr:serine hydrolase [Saprospiraceae bacterium]